MFTCAELAYTRNGHRHHHSFGGSSAGPAAAVQSDGRHLKYGRRINLDLACPEPVDLLGFKLEFRPGLSQSKKMMVNGFQSWSGSGEMSSSERLPPLFRAAYPVLAPYGDYRFHHNPGRRGEFHSWTYTYFTVDDDEIILMGSLDEREGYTLFDYSYRRDRLVVIRDCAGAHCRDSYPLLRLYMGRGKPGAVFDEYFRAMGLPRQRSPRVTGWCSWYNYYTRVSEADVMHNLKALSSRELPLDYFQIDDGWQAAIGDWLECNAKFPSGMQKIAAAIREHGFEPGLWLAPFICDRRARIYRENPEWLLRDRRGRPVKAGYNPGWNGWFYALDFYAPGFKDYLRRVFAQLRDEWGYRLFKLDFLYAAALLPGRGKTRGAIMTEAMDFIRDVAGESKLLGCGVPLGPAMGRVDYCRIGSDVASFWDLPLKGLSYRERYSTGNSLRSTAGRYHLDRRAFRNDPDVFLLRDGRSGVNQNRLNKEQRKSLFFLNHLLGGLVFFSDDPEEYTAGQSAILRSGFPGAESEIESLESRRGLYRIEFRVKRRRYLALANLTARSRAANLADGPFFHADHFVVPAGSTLLLAPYETACLYRIEPREGRPYLLGAPGHIFPGAQIEKLILRVRSVTLKLHEQASSESRVYLAVPQGMTNLVVNKTHYPVTVKGGNYFVTVPFQE